MRIIRSATGRALLFLLFTIPFQSSYADAKQGSATCDIIPQPYFIDQDSDSLSLSSSPGCHIEGDFAGSLYGYIEQLGAGFSAVSDRRDAILRISISDSPDFYVGKVHDIPFPHDTDRLDQAYVLTVRKDGIDIVAKSLTGAFYALQTLRQLTDEWTCSKIPVLTVADFPRFAYRGLLFDVSRHFRTKEFLMKQMDVMALFKINRMHLHLTDAAGWRLQIDSCPELTDVAAWRPQRTWREWQEEGAGYCIAGMDGAYGGFYTKDDIRELLAYAGSRCIEIIPEIEMPGHSAEVLAACPELACSGASSSPQDLCPGKESTFSFLENVLSEVADLFPSRYVHIGGDEASGKDWESCSDCRRRMREEGLDGKDELQSYMMKRVSAFLATKGKQVVGWDEILQGGAPENAVVMSWRGTKGGVEAVKKGHQVIMSPNYYCYLDYTQDAFFKEPLSIGGYVPLEKVYSYDPAGVEFTPEEKRYVLGIQGNLWAEFVVDDAHAEYMYYPRAFAIAECGWTVPEKKNFTRFRKSAEKQCGILREKGYSTFDLSAEFGERRESLEMEAHLGAGAEVSYAYPYDASYSAGGDSALVDGIRGGWSFDDGKWQAFTSDMDVTLDLGEIRDIHYVGAAFLHHIVPQIYAPEKVEIYFSEDGKAFDLAKTVYTSANEKDPYVFYETFSFSGNGRARFIRFNAVRRPGKLWLFTDEITVY